MDRRNFIKDLAISCAAGAIVAQAAPGAEKFRPAVDDDIDASHIPRWRIKDHQVDHEYGGLYDTIERDGAVTDHTKARIWKEAYHDGRALLNVTARLKKLAGAGL